MECYQMPVNLGIAEIVLASVTVFVAVGWLIRRRRSSREINERAKRSNLEYDSICTILFARCQPWPAVLVATVGVPNLIFGSVNLALALKPVHASIGQQVDCSIRLSLLWFIFNYIYLFSILLSIVFIVRHIVVTRAQENRTRTNLTYSTLIDAEDDDEL